MRKKNTMLAALMTAFLAVTAMGCSADSQAKNAVPTDDALPGVYELISYSSGTEDDPNAVTAEEIQMMKEYGMTCTLTVNKDGTALLDVFGEEQELEWKDGSFVMMDKSESPYYLNESELIITSPDTSYSMTFQRIDGKESGLKAEIKQKDESNTEAEEPAENNAEQAEKTEEK